MAINNITQTISTIPEAAHRGVDVQTLFVTKQEDFQDHLQGVTVNELNGLVAQQNTMAVEMNSTATQVNTNANTATTKASEASASALSASTSASIATTKASEASTSRNQAETFAQQASASALSVDVNNIVHIRSTNITVNVGAGQTYTTINQALEYLSGFYPMYKKSGVTATINLKAGFVMAEQVLVSGIDLGWITIVGEDAETIITHTALTTSFKGHFPAFGVDKGGTSPVIGQLFRFNVEKVGGNKHGLMTFGAGSSAHVLPDKGFIGAGANGIAALAASTVSAYGANCSNAGNYGIIADQGSTVSAYGANCSNAGANGIVAYASTVNAYDTNCSNAGNYGIAALAGSTVNAISANCSNAGTYGIVANEASTVNAILATVQNQTTGSARIIVVSGGMIVAPSINTTGGTVPVFSQAVNTLTANGIIYQ